MKPLVVKVNEAAELIRCSRLTILKLIGTGELAAVKVGGEWRIKAEDVEKIVGKIPSGYGK